MGAEKAEQSTVTAASPQTCFDAIAQFGTYPERQSAVKRCVVRERDGDGLGDGTTRATYRLAIDAGALVPGPIRRLLADQVMRSSVAELEARVEGT